MPEHDRNERPVYSDWIPREAGGGPDWFKVEVALPGVAGHETGDDAAGRTWFRLRALREAGSEHFFFRLL